MSKVDEVIITKDAEEHVETFLFRESKLEETIQNDVHVAKRV